jgi:hypothetical protein
LRRAPAAIADLEARRTIGKIIVQPGGMTSQPQHPDGATDMELFDLREQRTGRGYRNHRHHRRYQARNLLRSHRQIRRQRTRLNQRATTANCGRAGKEEEALNE